MMADLMRRNQRWVMIIVSVIVILSFIGFYSMRTGQTGRGGPGEDAVVARLYDRPVTRGQLERTDRQFRTAFELGLPNFTRQEFSGDRQNYLWNLLVIRREAESMGFRPSDAEVVEAIKKVPFFQADGGRGFDPAKYARFVENRLGPRGFSQRELEDLVRADLEIGRVGDLLASTVVVPVDEVKADYEMVFTKTSASVIRLKAADLAKGVEVKEEDVAKYYGEEKDHLLDPERRRVGFVAFTLTDEQKKLPAVERTALKQKLANRADEFTQKMLEPGADFAKTAAAFELPVTETPEFAKANAGPALKDLPIIPLDSVADFAASAFRLTANDPNSDALTGPDQERFLVLHLLNIIPARPLTLDEARPKIVESLKNTRARENLTAEADTIRKGLLEALARGQSLADAARAAGQTATDLAPFTLSEPPYGIQDADMIIEKVAALNAGELPTLQTTPEGGLLVYVRGREPLDEAQWEKQKATLITQQRLGRERVAFAEWLRAAREGAGLNLGALAEG